MTMQKENRRTVRTSVAHVGFAVVCLGVAVAGVIALVAVIFLLGTGTPYWGGETDLAAALLADMGWLGLFAVQHSGMARLAFKRRWAHFVPANPERFVYSAVSGALTLLLPLWWQPLPGEPLWQLPLPFAAVALLAGVAMGIVALSLDPLGCVGFAELSKSGGQLRIVGPYRWVRHPQMACALLFLWGWPVMPPTLALLSGGLTAYIFLALPLEERDLVARFGQAYLEYRQRVPMLLPWRAPAPRAVLDEVAP